MPRKKKKCIIDGCNTLTNGEMCITHSREKRKKKIDTYYEMQRNHTLNKKYGISLNEFWGY